MAKAPSLYTRLTRSPVNLGVYRSLWLGPDHILQVESTGYTESYQRFGFSDIQAFFIAGSNRRTWWNVIWGIWILITGIFFLAAITSHEVPAVSSVFLAIGIGFVVWNNALGKSCRVYVVTKVQTVQLGALARRRKAQRILGRLQPMIEAAQAGLQTSEVVAVSAETAASMPAVPPSVPEASANTETAPTPPPT